MNIISELSYLEDKGVFIHLDYDHYSTGTNCLWSIEFREIKKQTFWYGDNHEFGNVSDSLIAAVKLANWLLKEDNLCWYFFDVKETVSEEGLQLFKTKEEYKKRHNEFITTLFKK